MPYLRSEIQFTQVEACPCGKTKRVKRSVPTSFAPFTPFSSSEPCGFLCRVTQLLFWPQTAVIFRVMSLLPFWAVSAIVPVYFELPKAQFKKCGLLFSNYTSVFARVQIKSWKEMYSFSLVASLFLVLIYIFQKKTKNKKKTFSKSWNTWES